MKKFIQDTQFLLGHHLTEDQTASFALYEKELQVWNEQFNLTAIRDVEGVHTKHFLDSMSCLIALREKPPGKLIDVGSGAGFPGIPLKIIFPSMSLTLVESVGKKAEFCRHIASLLKFEQTEILQVRAEELGQVPRHREKYDWAVARAVANLSILLEYLLPLVRIGGSIIAQKGKSGPLEAQEAEPAANILGGQLQPLYSYFLPGILDERYLVVCNKISATPSKYPRRVGAAHKMPIKYKMPVG
jgi:16S rRNA (guanine527-N7)-methyltransferase